MARFRRWGAGAIALSLSGCTVLGLTMGGLYASGQNGDPQVQAGQAPRTSVAKSMLLGGVIGLALDIGFVALSIREDGLGH